MKKLKFFSIILFPIVMCSMTCKHASHSNPSVGAGPATSIDSALVVPAAGVNVSGKWLKEAEPKLKRWFTWYGERLPDFFAQNFVVLDTLLEVEFPELPVEETDPGFEKYRLPSPDRKLKADLYSYEHKLVSAADGKISLEGTSLDSEVSVSGIKPGYRTRVLFCGSSCYFEDAAWLDDNKLVIAGFSDETDKKNHPMLWRIDLKQQSVWRYQFPGALPADKDNYIHKAVLAPNR